jgi:hypothetical protein
MDAAGNGPGYAPKKPITLLGLSGISDAKALGTAARMRARAIWIFN